MKKIISLFQRNYDGDRLVRNEVVPGAEWVIVGEGIATRKWDGSCCMIRDGLFYKRYDNKKGRVPPEGFEPAQEKDEVTGHQPGWVPVGGGPEDQWFRAALENACFDVENNKITLIPDGTYEACGPHFQGNPERWIVDNLVIHGGDSLDTPRDYNGLRSFFMGCNIEGIVWHHPDGRMVKIKAKDFGIKRHETR